MFPALELESGQALLADRVNVSNKYPKDRLKVSEAIAFAFEFPRRAKVPALTTPEHRVLPNPFTPAPHNRPNSRIRSIRSYYARRGSEVEWGFEECVRGMVDG